MAALPNDTGRRNVQVASRRPTRKAVSSHTLTHAVQSSFCLQAHPYYDYSGWTHARRSVVVQCGREGKSHALRWTCGVPREH
jgi:hypothetical protein